MVPMGYVMCHFVFQIIARKTSRAGIFVGWFAQCKSFYFIDPQFIATSPPVGHPKWWWKVRGLRIYNCPDVILRADELSLRILVWEGIYLFSGGIHYQNPRAARRDPWMLGCMLNRGGPDVTVISAHERRLNMAELLSYKMGWCRWTGAKSTVHQEKNALWVISTGLNYLCIKGTMKSLILRFLLDHGFHICGKKYSIWLIWLYDPLFAG